MYVRQEYPARSLSVSTDEDGTYKSVWCKTKLSHRGYENVGIIYRSPGSDSQLLLDDLDRFGRGGHCLIFGDFNAPAIDWETNSCPPGTDTYTRELHSTIADLYLHQHVHDPTRETDSSSNILDLVLTPRESDVTNLQLLPPLGNSDHNVLQFQWYRGTPSVQPSRKRFNVWKIDFEKMRESARCISWDDGYLNVNESWTIFRDRISELTRSMAPPWRTRPRGSGPPWFDPQLRMALRQRNRAWKQFRNTGLNYLRYKQIRNYCTELKLIKRRAYEERLAVESVDAPKRLCLPTSPHSDERWYTSYPWTVWRD